MSQQFLENKDIQSQNLINKTVDYMTTKYRQFQKVFSYSDPYGQLILVSKNLSKIVIFYIKDSINEMSFHTARRKESVYGLAQLQGHNAFRGSGATTSISLNLKSDGTNTAEVGSQVFLPNYMRLKCKQNDLLYYVNLGQDFIKFDTVNQKNTPLVVNQGEMKITTFVANGRDIQTYSIPLKDKMVDMNHIMVQINGKVYRIFEGVEEFEFDGYNCMVRTGLTGGIDIIFGKSVSSKIPQSGETVSIYYPVVDGSSGNERYPIFEFLDQGFKLNGEPINMNQYFDIKPEASLEFGSDGESLEETRLVAPNVSKNRIIHDKKSLKYFLTRMNLFGDVKIFNDDQPSVLETYLFPKLENVVGDTEDYFNFDQGKVLLSEDTRLRLLKLMANKRSQNIDIVLKNPVIKDYSMVVKVDAFRFGSNGLDINIDELRLKIRSTISDYMLLMKRTNKIPKSDIVKIVDDVAGVDSVFVEFMIEEADMRDEFGNIIVEKNELALPSLNFIDENGDNITEALQIDIKLIIE